MGGEPGKHMFMQDILSDVREVIKPYMGQPVEIRLALTDDHGNRGMVVLRMNMWRWNNNYFNSTFYEAMIQSQIENPTNIELLCLNLIPEHFN